MTATNAMLALALLLVAAAALFDLRTGHIPNWLNLAGLALGSALQLYVLIWDQRPATQVLSAALLGLAVARVCFSVIACAVVPYLLFLRNGIGGGDVKLLAALGACLGPVLGLEVELYAFVALALFAPARLAYEGRLLTVLGNSAALLTNPLLPKERRRQVAPELLSSIKFGPAAFAAMALVCLLRWRSA